MPALMAQSETAPPTNMFVKIRTQPIALSLSLLYRAINNETHGNANNGEARGSVRSDFSFKSTQSSFYCVLSLAIENYFDLLNNSLLFVFT